MSRPWLGFRGYFLLGVALYWGNALLIIGSGHFHWITAVIGHTPLLNDALGMLYAMAFAATGGIKLAAAIAQGERTMRLAVIAGAGMSTVWTLVTLTGALFYQVAPAIVLTWAYIAVITYASYPLVYLGHDYMTTLQQYSSLVRQRMTEVADTLPAPEQTHDGEP